MTVVRAAGDSHLSSGSYFQSLDFLAQLPPLDRGWSIICAAIIAILGLMYTARQERRRLRREHTHRVLDKLNDWQSLDKNLAVLRKHFDSGTSLNINDPSQASIQTSADWVLDRYEFVAAAVLSGDLDENLIRQVEEGSMCRPTLLLYDYISQARELEGRNTIYENLEFITLRWRKRKISKIFSWPIDAFVGRPLTTAVAKLFRQVWTPNVASQAPSSSFKVRESKWMRAESVKTIKKRAEGQPTPLQPMGG